MCVCVCVCACVCACVCVGITPVVPTHVYPGLGALDKSVMPPSIVHTFIQVLQCGNFSPPYLLPGVQVCKIKFTSYFLNINSILRNVPISIWRL